MIKNNLQTLLNQLKNGNNLGEEITLVGATKTQSIEDINLAINYGLQYVAENKVQEFREKHGKLSPCHEHFIGHLQTNKVKYLIGNVELIHSVDRLELAKEISKQSQNKKVITNVLLQINIGDEQTKGGFEFENFIDIYNEIKQYPHLRVKGLMAMLPNIQNEKELANMCLQMRQLYDIIKKTNDDICYLSVGMTNDYLIAIKNGSNMIRVGSGIFGNRNY